MELYNYFKNNVITITINKRYSKTMWEISIKYLKLLRLLAYYCTFRHLTYVHVLGFEGTKTVGFFKLNRAPGAVGSPLDFEKYRHV